MLQVLRLATYLAHYSEDVALGLLDVSEDDRGDMLLDARHHFPDVCENRPGRCKPSCLRVRCKRFTR